MFTKWRLVISIALLIMALFAWFLGYLSQTPEAIITWSTESEVDTAGFDVYRATNEEGPYEKVTEKLILSSGDPFTGGNYDFRDMTIEPGVTYFYQLEELETTGNLTRLPDVVRFEGQNKLIATVNWTAVSIFLTILIFLWLIPSPSSSLMRTIIKEIA
jgi:hypothetical protein